MVIRLNQSQKVQLERILKKIKFILLLHEIFTVLCLLASSPCTHRFFPRILRQFCEPQTTLNLPYSPYTIKYFLYVSSESAEIMNTQSQKDIFTFNNACSKKSNGANYRPRMNEQFTNLIFLLSLKVFAFYVCGEYA